MLLEKAGNNGGAGWRLDGTYARLPKAFWSRVEPTPVGRPQLAMLNQALARELGLDADGLAGEEGVAVFSGNRLPVGAEPIAQAYSGHQFGNFTRLGDGRAILLGEQITPDGRRMDIVLKGAGRTPYSRGGDGRAALGPMLREYVMSEAMHGLGIPTTRSLAVVTMGEPVFREKPLSGAILTRVASSHIRVGTFEQRAALGDAEGVGRLVRYTLERHAPELVEADNPALALLEWAMDLQISLMTEWARVGFVHGVMNTDNMALSGETLDYGPCAFIDGYDPEAVFSSIDVEGRYAFGRQPDVAGWNLTRLAVSLLPVMDADRERAVELARGIMGRYPERYLSKWQAMMRRKLGLMSEESGDQSLMGFLLDWMAVQKRDYTQTFRRLLEGPAADGGGDPTWAEFLGRWGRRLESQPQPWSEVRALMEANNPAVIPRNHRVEAALDAAVEGGDPGPIRELLSVLSNPYRATAGILAAYGPPPAGTGPYRTFCGT